MHMFWSRIHLIPLTAGPSPTTLELHTHVSSKEKLVHPDKQMSRESEEPRSADCLDDGPKANISLVRARHGFITGEC